MGTVTVSSPNLAAVARKLAAARQTLGDRLAPATQNIADTVHTAIDTRYGPVAKYWHVDATATSVRAWGDHQHLLWWEFGTRAHGIDPVQAKMLRFTPQGATNTVFAKHVNHPGTPAHNQRDGVVTTLSYAALFEWHAALSDLLQTL